ncbi:MAG: GNAT family N-acetyltransferase [Bacteroidetes bacterium]|nr:GNAT family N-acetyltransferase [Bacteroidota bacterium]
MPNIHIRPFISGDENQISKLIHEVFDEFVAPGYSAEGNSFFYDFITPSAIAIRQQEQNNILLAFLAKELAGMIEMRDNNHVSLLFTHKDYMGQGIARELLNDAISICLARNPDVQTISVNASPYSIPIYQRLGFVPIGLLQQNNGITFLPMEMNLY